jgi:hypothetical protein
MHSRRVHRLKSAELLVPAVQVSRLLGRVFSVFGCMQAVSMGDMSVVACCLVVARISMISRFPMMLGSCIEMLGRFGVVMMNFVLVAHGSLRLLKGAQSTGGPSFSTIEKSSVTCVTRSQNRQGPRSEGDVPGSGPVGWLSGWNQRHQTAHSCTEQEGPATFRRCSVEPGCRGVSECCNGCMPILIRSRRAMSNVRTRSQSITSVSESPEHER